jgi:phage replication-related protein YjqB (UPF0714/DUF867 family)
MSEAGASLEVEARYRCYAELQSHEVEGRDYRIILKLGRSGVLVLAPHGGCIEPGSSEIATAVAADDHSLYIFEGLKPAGNWNLHLASTRFDEPVCISALKQSKRAITIHGCRDKSDLVYLGGLDIILQRSVEDSLSHSGFITGRRDGITGRSEQNICNRNVSASGVQIELSRDLRFAMFVDLKVNGGRQPTPIFHRFVAALRAAIDEF